MWGWKISPSRFVNIFKWLGFIGDFCASKASCFEKLLTTEIGPFWKVWNKDNFSNILLMRPHLKNKLYAQGSAWYEYIWKSWVLVCSKEIREGGHQLLEKLQMYRPLIAVFNGKCKLSICYSKHIFMMKVNPVWYFRYLWNILQGDFWSKGKELRVRIAALQSAGNWDGTSFFLDG